MITFLEWKLDLLLNNLFLEIRDFLPKVEVLNVDILVGRGFALTPQK